MKKVMLVFLVAVFVLTPVLAVAGGSGSSAPPSGSSGAGGKSTTPGTPGTKTDSPAASPGGDTMAQHKTKAACEKAGGMWSEAGKACSKKK